MNQLNKNRLIGGGVLIFAALLFAPAILNPKPNNLSNPTLAVNISSTDTAEKPSLASQSNNVGVVTTMTDSVVQAQPPIKLESVVSAANAPVPNAVTTKTQTPKQETDRKITQQVPIALSKTPSVTARKNTVKRNSWLRVGSFSSKANANNLLKQLEKKYPVKVETISIDGKTYHRVLVGPYSDETQLKKTKTALSKSGYKPGIQR